MDILLAQCLQDLCGDPVPAGMYVAGDDEHPQVNEISPTLLNLPESLPDYHQLGSDSNERVTWIPGSSAGNATSEEERQLTLQAGDIEQTHRQQSAFHTKRSNPRWLGADLSIPQVDEQAPSLASGSNLLSSEDRSEASQNETKQPNSTDSLDSIPGASTTASSIQPKSDNRPSLKSPKEEVSRSEAESNTVTKSQPASEPTPTPFTAESTAIFANIIAEVHRKLGLAYYHLNTLRQLGMGTKTTSWNLKCAVGGEASPAQEKQGTKVKRKYRKRVRISKPGGTMDNENDALQYHQSSPESTPVNKHVIKAIKRRKIKRHPESTVEAIVEQATSISHMNGLVSRTKAVPGLISATNPATAAVITMKSCSSISSSPLAASIGYLKKKRAAASPTRSAKKAAHHTNSSLSCRNELPSATKNEVPLDSSRQVSSRR